MVRHDVLPSKVFTSREAVRWAELSQKAFAHLSIPLCPPTLCCPEPSGYEDLKPVPAASLTQGTANKVTVLHHADMVALTPTLGEVLTVADC